MTTLAYAGICRSALSFTTQLWLRPEIVPGLREITDGIHAAGAKASIQIGHCGNMTHRSTAGCTPVGASTGFNLYSPTFCRGLRRDEIKQIARCFGDAVRTARDAGFDCVEVHAGHGYLISQFLSPYTNRRRDEFGGTLSNRMKFMNMCLEEALSAAGDDMAVIVKTNMRDGFKGGLEIDDCLTVAREIERTRHRAFGRIREQGADVRDARRDAHLLHDILHEAALAEIRRSHGGPDDDSLRAVQAALFPRRRAPVPPRAETAADICGRGR
jgi:2,4-dienoyl-CoA reductase-like NADH-dependent reductase (Old Yellow Enzyme family)